MFSQLPYNSKVQIKQQSMDGSDDNEKELIWNKKVEADNRIEGNGQ
jgi:hypothetical protein